MNNTLINKEIIENRQKQAPKLKKQRERLQKLEEALTAAEQSQAFENKPQKIRHYINEVRELAARIERKVRLFEKGVINIAVAGTEKAGKTTFLKNLTGIEDLPAANERCTAVSCEITHVADSSREGITVVYYKEDELLDIINCEVEHLNKGNGTIWEKPEEYAPLPKVENLSAFSSMRLPEVTALSSLKVLNYKPALEHLHAIQKALGSNFSLLGQKREDSIANLRTLAAHSNATDQQPLINRLLVRKCYPNGDEHQCLCDTPGVDDPNPHALRRTLKTLKEDTDMLVILDRPKDSPSIAGSLAQFIANLGQVSDKDYPIRERAIFLVNWYKPADADGGCARTRLAKIRDENVIPNLPPPCDVTDEASLNQFKAYLNERLNEVLPREDEKMIQSLWDEISNLENGVRNEVIKPLQEQAPKLPTEMEEDVLSKFSEWFNKWDGGGFFGRLREKFEGLTENPCEEEKLDEMLREVDSIRTKWEEVIKKAVQTEITEENVKSTVSQKDKEPYRIFFPRYQVLFRQYVNELSRVVAKISPYVQERVEKVLSGAMGESIYGQLCAGGEAKDRLASLGSRLVETNACGDVPKLIEGLKELETLEDRVSYVSADELRPALNLLDVPRWRYGRIDDVKDQALDVFKGAQDMDSETKKVAEFLSRKDLKAPSPSNPEKDHVNFLRRVIFSAECYINERMKANAKKFRSLMEDCASNAALELCTQDGAEEGWRDALRRLRQYIFRDMYAAQREKSANAAKCKELIDALRNAIGDESNR